MEQHQLRVGALEQRQKLKSHNKFALGISVHLTLRWQSGCRFADLHALMLEHLRAMKPGDPPFSARSFYDEAGKLNIVFAE
jgi:hypothetical protein